MKKDKEREKIVADFEKAVEKQKKFMKTEYRTFSDNDKINYWATIIRQQFRWNEESGIDGYSVFSKESYISWKNEEPKIDEFLPHIAKKVGLSIDKINSEILT